MEGDDVGLGRQLFHRGRAGVVGDGGVGRGAGCAVAGALPARRVAEQQGETHLPQVQGHGGAHMAHADDAHGGARGQPAAVDEGQQGRGDILCHARGIAAGAVGPAYAGAAEVVAVQVVVADGGGGDEAHGGAGEQGGVAAGTGADNEDIGLHGIVTADGGAGHVAHGA